MLKIEGKKKTAIFEYLNRFSHQKWLWIREGDDPALLHQVVALPKITQIQEKEKNVKTLVDHQPLFVTFDLIIWLWQLKTVALYIMIKIKGTVNNLLRLTLFAIIMIILSTRDSLSNYKLGLAAEVQLTFNDCRLMTAITGIVRLHQKESTRVHS